MIAYFCDQCQKQIPEKSLKNAPKSGEALLCTNCLRTQEKTAPNQILCEGCQAPILPIDLKTGKAFIREQAFYCARCVRKLTQHSQSIQHQKITQIFLFFGFPLLTAIILFAIFSSASTPSKNNSEEKNSQNKTSHPDLRYPPENTWTEQEILANKNRHIEGTLSTEELLKLQEKSATQKTESSKNSAIEAKKILPSKEPQEREILPTPPSDEKLKQWTENLRNLPEPSMLERLENPATQLLALLELKEATPAILHKIHNSLILSQDPLLRATSARVLGIFQSPTSTELLIRMMSDPEKIVRNAAKESLRKITNNQYVNSKDLDLSEEVKEALKKALREKD
ncbi:MAG: HEAT repeat domain-containing protein [Planctomycetota bacterium]